MSARQCAFSHQLLLVLLMVPASGVAEPGTTVPAADAAGENGDADAPYVPSPHSVVARMLELADVSEDDYVIDLGSGDGRIVLTAAAIFGARGLGVEIRQDLVERSRRAARRQGLADRTRFVRQDLFASDISPATIVTVYLLPETLARLRGKLLRELTPGTRVLSHDYPLPDWDPERFVQLEHPAKVDITGTSRTNLYLYRVPAQVDGAWRAAVPAKISDEPLHLEFAQVATAGRGRARLGEMTVPLEDVKVSGARLRFDLPVRDARFTAQVHGSRLEGAVRVAGETHRWQAERR